MSLQPIHQDNLVQTVKELRYLVAALLSRSGLDDKGVLQAFEVAEAETRKLDETLMDTAARLFHATPEGQEAVRLGDAERQRREHQIWKEDCIEEGRIRRHPASK